MFLDDRMSPVDDSFQLDDTYAGHQQLSLYLRQFVEKHPQSIIYTALESTGGYENNWHRTLCALGSSLPVHVARLNPAWVKANHNARAKRNKTDSISAADIAEYLISHPDRVSYDEEDSFPNLRRQWSFIQLNLKQKSQLLSHLESVLYTTMPELLAFCQKGAPDWLLKLLKRYSSYQAIQRAGVAKLSKIPYVTNAKAQRILDKIAHKLGYCDEVSAQIIQMIATQILTLDLQIKKQKKYLEKNYDEAKEQVDLLNTFKGIGIYSAIGLLLNINGVHRFADAKKLASYFGLHPVYKKSGDGAAVVRMSKQGRAEPRGILYMVAWSAVQHNPLIKEIYARSMAKAMCRNAALGVCMHKILRIVYGMLLHNKPFDPEIDRRNQKQNETKKQTPQNTKKRRLQAFDGNAPVSQKQSKIRKEQLRSQDENIAKNGITKSAPSVNLE
jgi:transposase